MDECYSLSALTLRDTDTVKPHINIIKTKCSSSSSFRECVNMNFHLQPEKEIISATLCIQI